MFRILGHMNVGEEIPPKTQDECPLETIYTDKVQFLPYKIVQNIWGARV